jgi:hypothetical protein
MATSEDYAKMSDSEKKKEDWMNSKWRPMMGWMYMVVCIADFVLFPILWSLVQAWGDGKVEMQWQPITLQGAGLFHIAMGAILGIAAYGRTQEKMVGANNGGLSLPAPAPAPAAPAPSFGAPAVSSPAPSFGAPAATPAPAFKPAPSFDSAPTAMSSTGKPMPVQPEQPQL